MSVPPGDRGKSSMQFVETARNIERRAIQICHRWTKSYMFFITQRTVNLASSIYEHAQKANAIFPIMTEEERTERIIELERALGSLYAFAQKIELAYSIFPICGEKSSRVSEAEKAEKSGRILEEFMNMCLDEEEALTGNLHWTRAAELCGKSTKKTAEKLPDQPDQ